MNSFTKLLLKKFLDWQKKEDERRTVAQFAEYIGLGHKTVSHALNGTRSPSRKTVEHLAKFFKEPKFYDAAEMARPDPNLHYVIRNWGNMPIEAHKRIAEEVRKYTSEKPPED